MSSSHDLLNLKASKKAYAIFILETATTFKGTKTWKFYNASVRGLHLQQKYFVYRTWNLYFIRLKKYKQDLIHVNILSSASFNLKWERFMLTVRMALTYCKQS